MHEVLGWLGIALLIIYLIGIPIIAGIVFQSYQKDDKDKGDKEEGGGSLFAAIFVGVIWPFALLMVFGEYLHDKFSKENRAKNKKLDSMVDLHNEVNHVLLSLRNYYLKQEDYKNAVRMEAALAGIAKRFAKHSEWPPTKKVFEILHDYWKNGARRDYLHHVAFRKK